MTNDVVDKPVGRPVFDHLAALTDEHGLHEHASHAVPRRDHGYCVDDVARGLVVTCREPRPGPLVGRLRERYLSFVLDAVSPDGTCHNRMGPDGRWTDEAGLGDWWGRAVWGLGVAAARSPLAGERARALSAFRILAQQRTPFARSAAFALLGAGELLRARPGEPAARHLLDDLIGIVDSPPEAPGDPDWPWPEPRLRYANGAVAEALLVTGEGVGDVDVVARGLELLTFLLRVEVRDGHLSVTPVAGRGPGDLAAGFDQQPIEVAALADACSTAFRITDDKAWLAGIDLALRWFDGDNDAMTQMYDPISGGGFDGLEPDGRNANQGAESTLAMLSTLQQAHWVHALR